MRKAGLGKGVKALIEMSEREANLLEVPVALLKTSIGQPRIDKESDIEELVESVKRHGILQPLLVTRMPDGTYEIVAGERRFIAAIRAGLEKVPVLVGEWSERDKAIISLIENVHRKDLDPVEEALYYERLVNEFQFTREEVAEIVGKSRSYISNLMRVLNLPDEIKDAIRKGLITLGHAKAILSLRNSDEMLNLFREIVDRGLNVRDSERLARMMKKKKTLVSTRVVVLKGDFEGVRVRFTKKKAIMRVTIEGPEDKIEKLITNMPLD